MTILKKYKILNSKGELFSISMIGKIILAVFFLVVAFFIIRSQFGTGMSINIFGR